MSVKVLYFASLKEFLQRSEDTVEIPQSVKTVEDLKSLLAQSNPLLKEAFNKFPRLRCSVNQEMASDKTPVKDGDEVAIFPPVTGG